MNKYLIILGCAFNPSNKQVTAFGGERTKQYVEGLGKVAELAKEIPNFDFVLVDNTITPEWQMPEAIKQALNRIPNLKTELFYDNELAAINKGSGVLAAWKKLLAENYLKPYEFCLYFEPRQKLISFNFFKKFLQAPANYFLITRHRVTASTRWWPTRLLFKIFPVYIKQIQTGLFSISAQAFSNYITAANLQNLADKHISLEKDMYDKLRNLNMRPVERLGFVWHNAFTNEDIEF